MVQGFILGKAAELLRLEHLSPKATVTDPFGSLTWNYESIAWQVLLGTVHLYNSSVHNISETFALRGQELNKAQSLLWLWGTMQAHVGDWKWAQQTCHWVPVNKVMCRFWSWASPATRVCGQGCLLQGADSLKMDLAARGQQWGEESRAHRPDCGSSFFLRESTKYINAAVLSSD